MKLHGDEFLKAERKFKRKYKSKALRRDVEELLDKLQLWDLSVAIKLLLSVAGVAESPKEAQ